MPSLLAADQSMLASEVDLCVKAGATYFHVDVCDGSQICSNRLHK